MKTTRITLFAAAAVLALSACGGKQPGDTLIAMHDELCETGDPSVMAKYASKKSQPALGMITAVMAEPEKAEQTPIKIIVPVYVAWNCRRGGRRRSLLGGCLGSQRDGTPHQNGESGHNDHRGLRSHQDPPEFDHG